MHTATRPTAPTITRTITRTVTIAEPLDAELLRDIAAGVASATTLWRPLVRHDPAGREPVRLLATEAYEVWAIGWAPGQRTELHDHGHAAGHLLVVQGVLTEHEVEVDGTHRQLRRTELPTSTARDLPIGVVHEVGNHSRRPATSIHVYSPPLRTMTHYDAASLTPTITEIIPAELPALATTASSLLRHPSLRD